MPVPVQSWPAEIVNVLCCPTTHQRLRVVTPAEAVALGVGTREVLLREDGRVCYPLDPHGFPDLVPDHAVPIPGLREAAAS